MNVLFIQANLFHFVDYFFFFFHKLNKKSVCAMVIRRFTVQKKKSKQGKKQKKSVYCFTWCVFFFFPSDHRWFSSTKIQFAKQKLYRAAMLDLRYCKVHKFFNQSGNKISQQPRQLMFLTSTLFRQLSISIMCSIKFFAFDPFLF